MKKVLIILSTMLLALSCSKMADVPGIGSVTVGGKVGPVSESPFVYKP